MRRILGQLLLSIAAVATAVAPILNDWNDTHVFSSHWPPHARFHGAVSLGMTLVLSPLALWLTWRRSSDETPALAAAALVPIAYWGSFFAALLVPGARFEDPEHPLPRGYLGLRPI
jgi:hypothetical protein